jgi:hypothetical protein
MGSYNQGGPKKAFGGFNPKKRLTMAESLLDFCPPAKGEDYRITEYF